MTITEHNVITPRRRVIRSDDGHEKQTKSNHLIHSDEPITVSDRIHLTQQKINRAKL